MRLALSKTDTVDRRVRVLIESSVLAASSRLTVWRFGLDEERFTGRETL
jgi:hypothetical protein